MNDSKNQFKKHFLILGDDKEIVKYTDDEKLKKIINKDQKDKMYGIWATLGWKDDKPFNLLVSNSKYGNNKKKERDITTRRTIRDIAYFNKEIKSVKEEVLERYINFDNTEIDVDWEKVKTYDDIPELRLDLFVDEMEGAIMYYYHQEKAKFRDLKDKSVYQQYIQCERTDDKYSTKRDRLTYYFKMLPPYEYTINEEEEIEWTTKERTTSFIIKVVTFKRKSGTPDSLLHEFFSKENIELLAKTKGASATYTLFGQKKNALLIYDNSIESASVASSKKNRYDMRGFFHSADDEHPIDYNKKTLLLIHGTFSNTLNTFEGLVKLRNGGSELEDFLKIRDYEQVLAFNHPTISADVFRNTEELKKMLGPEEFKHSVSLLAASRGCIFAQAIGADKNMPFKVDKCLMFSPANGVGYFDLGKKVATGLGALKNLNSGSPAKYIFALLQFSAEYFLDQPGSKQMTFGSKPLTNVINGVLVDSNSKYTGIIDDWNKKLVKDKKHPIWMKLADAGIKLILGRKHDFVVGERGQLNLPPKYNVTPVFMASTHCKYFDKGQLQERKSGKEVVLSTFLSKYL